MLDVHGVQGWGAGRDLTGEEIEREIGRGARDELDGLGVQVGGLLEARVLVVGVALLFQGKCLPIGLDERRELGPGAELADADLPKLVVVISARDHVDELLEVVDLDREQLGDHLVAHLGAGMGHVHVKWAWEGACACGPLVACACFM